MTFKKDLRNGQTAEKFIADVLAEADIAAVANEDRDRLSDYDLEATLNNRVFWLEAKYDLYEARSGNIAIEFFNPKSNRPTGIDATKADLWVHVLSNPLSAWITGVPTLRRYIRENDPVRVVERGGDDNSSILLYRRELIVPAIFERLDGLSPDALRKLILKLLGRNGNRSRSTRDRPQSAHKGKLAFPPPLRRWSTTPLTKRFVA